MSPLVSAYGSVSELTMCRTLVSESESTTFRTSVYGSASVSELELTMFRTSVCGSESESGWT